MRVNICFNIVSQICAGGYKVRLRRDGGVPCIFSTWNNGNAFCTCHTEELFDIQGITGTLIVTPFMN
jgi:hypothetical protein